MREIIFYKLNGTIKSTTVLTKETLTQCHGMKVKCHLKDGTAAVGFADVYGTNNAVHDSVYLRTYDHLDEARHELIGPDDTKYDQTFHDVPLCDITKIEAILHSNPRWGTMLTNEFSFVYS